MIMAQSKPTTSPSTKVSLDFVKDRGFSRNSDYKRKLQVSTNFLSHRNLNIDKPFFDKRKRN